MLIKTSVRKLISFVMRAGDIDNSFVSSSRMVRGIRAHQKLQGSYKGDYKIEYSLSHTCQIEGLSFKVEGRADGIIKEKEGYLVDEIKSTTRPLKDFDPRPIHWAQAKCYGYFFCLEKDLDEIDIQLSYYNIDDENTKVFRETFTIEELKDFYHGLIKAYLDFSKALASYRERRDQSLEDLAFPFPYRKGQEDLARAVYLSVLNKKKLFAEAPTGIGKTMSCLYPSLKAMGQGLADQTFYLTAKSTTKTQASTATRILIEKGLFIKGLVLTAKEKVCLNDQVSCNPDDCPYARGHYDRVNEALLAILEKEDLIDQETLASYSEKYRVCPFEFQLDIGSYSDLVICDYNYVFDPSAYLKSFFDMDDTSYIFLIDEAHNLVDRSRDMFSASIAGSDLEGLLEGLGKDQASIKKKAAKALSLMDSLKADLGPGEKSVEDGPKKLVKYLEGILKKLDPLLARSKGQASYDQLLDFYFKALDFIRIYDFYDGSYKTIYRLDSGKIKVKLFCIDPQDKVRSILARARSFIFFSASLSPMNFYKDLLGGNPDDYRLHLASPFPEDRLFIASLDLSTRYKDRERTLDSLLKIIKSSYLANRGNYIVFFPSYAYMDKAYEAFIEEYPEIPTIKQDRSMSEGKREDFIKSFKEKDQVLGFCVLGGVFSEGIDLAGQDLIGCLIVSLGLPGLSLERKLIKDYFDKEGLGFAYAYQYPAMTKVVQAAGRVIRTSKDKGVVLLIDDRYLLRSYRRIMPRHWRQMKSYRGLYRLEEDLGDFWLD